MMNDSVVLMEEGISGDEMMARWLVVDMKPSSDEGIFSTRTSLLLPAPESKGKSESKKRNRSVCPLALT
jgi:hypothetical protein